MSSCFCNIFQHFHATQQRHVTEFSSTKHVEISRKWECHIFMLFISQFIWTKNTKNRGEWFSRKVLWTYWNTFIPHEQLEKRWKKNLAPNGVAINKLVTRKIQTLCSSSSIIIHSKMITYCLCEISGRWLAT